ncbi:MAG TPA: PilZ domain-containing protein [Fimbriimonadaceae bacterium]|nr:PilZ domain-containing protein [Fimbriimonadaceae bacterium]
MTERRSEDRWNQFRGCRVAIDGRSARLQDLSPHGARLECPANFPSESVVRFDLPWGIPVRANVLSSEAGLTRLRFDYEVEALAE